MLQVIVLKIQLMIFKLSYVIILDKDKFKLRMTEVEIIKIVHTNAHAIGFENIDALENLL